MYKTGVVVLLLWLSSCNGKENSSQPNSDGTATADKALVFNGFKKVAVPYSLSDTALMRDNDTATLEAASILSFIPDSLNHSLFGLGVHVKYTPLATLDEKNNESYFIVKATGGKKMAALLVVVNDSKKTGAAMPFLQPDNDPATEQVSTLDKSYSITRSVTRRIPDEPSVEGKDVYIYNSDAKSFTLIMTDLLDNDAVALINPIDTFSRNHRFAGDYSKDKKNIVSIRDAPNGAEFNFFIHIEKGEDCTGELKGTALMTSSKTAVFRQGGNPCVMEFSFSGSNVTIKEAEGCGSQRSIGCTMDGTFSKKKAAKPTERKASIKTGA